MKVLSGVFLLPLLAACGSATIWNGGDLEKWVGKEAVAKGCEPDSIELAAWYVKESDKNNWKGRCTNVNSGEEIQFSINVDSVWTPSPE